MIAPAPMARVIEFNQGNDLARSTVLKHIIDDLLRIEPMRPNGVVSAEPALGRNQCAHRHLAMNTEPRKRSLEVAERFLLDLGQEPLAPHLGADPLPHQSFEYRHAAEPPSDRSPDQSRTDAQAQGSDHRLGDRPQEERRVVHLEGMVVCASAVSFWNPSTSASVDASSTPKPPKPPKLSLCAEDGVEIASGVPMLVIDKDASCLTLARLTPERCSSIVLAKDYRHGRA